MTADEIDTLNRLTVIFLETAELRVKNRQPLMMDFWKTRVNALIADNGFPVLDHTGKITAASMEQIAHERYEQFNDRRKAIEADAADEEDRKNLESLEHLEKSVTKRANHER